LASVLYITYDGLLEPLGQSQVWQYLRKLALRHRITLLSFEKAEDLEDRERFRTMREKCDSVGIHWISLRYHRRPSAPATGFDVILGTVVAFWLIARYQVQIVHARSYVPSMIALVLKKLLGVSFIFDMRGFWVDERVDGGLWSADGKLYAIAKRFEREFILAADRILSLTKSGVDALKKPPFPQRSTGVYEVITTCTDLNAFGPSDVPASQSSFTLGYVGSVGVWYLFQEVARAFAALERVKPDARFLVINRGGHDLIRRALEAAGIDEGKVEVLSADPADIPALMRQMDAGVFFYKPSSSRTATAPTRLGEFLATGLPVWVNAGIGDVDEIVQNGDHPVGVIVGQFEDHVLERAARSLVTLAEERSTRALCRTLAEERFSSDVATEQYSRIYEELAR
jgi:glycosyltransferase involved in cell wall biosynthesis